MEQKLIEVNTPETLGVTPRFVLQHNAISRSAHNFSATAKKITTMAMALLPPDLSSLQAAFTFTDFCNALGYEKGGKSKTIFRAAIKECMESVIEVESPSPRKGGKNWVMHHWFSRAEWNADTGICTMTFDKDLADFLKELKNLYAKLNLTDIGKLQSRYAIRIFEIVLSYKSLQGKDGNDDNAWYVERTLEEIRKLFGIKEAEYQRTNTFRQKVIEDPVNEINEAGIGFKIKTESIKKGRNLVAIRLNCKSVPRATAAKKGINARAKRADLPDLTPKEEQTQTDKQNQHLRELYPEEFDAFYQEALDGMKSMPGNVGEIFRKGAANHSAFTKLREKHGIVK